MENNLKSIALKIAHKKFKSNPDIEFSVHLKQSWDIVNKIEIIKRKYKILALVKFNDGVALVLDKKPELIYKLIGGIIFGTDGLFYDCYEYGSCDKNWKAFGGRKFDIKLENGEIINCYGQWWHGGFNKVEKLIGRKIGHATAKTINGLKECYVFSGYEVDFLLFNEFIKTYSGIVYPYREYEKIIKFDDMRRKLSNEIYKLEQAKKSLIKEVKEKSLIIKNELI